MFYAGIGSRQTPAHILALMTRIAQHLHRKGWTLRSGGANGADSAFAAGTDRREIYLPWPRFNGISDGIVCGNDPRLLDIAADHHPRWDLCSRGARALHARNVAQILGRTADAPWSNHVICWTPNGSRSGGTGQALRIAHKYGIQIYDLAIPNDYAKFESL